MTTLQPLGGVVLETANTSGTNARNTILLTILTDQIVFAGWSCSLEEGIGPLYSRLIKKDKHMHFFVSEVSCSETRRSAPKSGKPPSVRGAIQGNSP